MQVDIGARTDTGLVREGNEDNFRVVPELALFVLSDGMGGEAHGETASRLSVEAVVEHCRMAAANPALPLVGDPRPDLSDRGNRLLSAVRRANRVVFQAALADPARAGMGATLVAAWLNGSRVSLAHVGDSRAYLLHSDRLAQLTEDHSLVAEQIRLGILTPAQAISSELQSVLTRALGIEEEAEIDVDEHSLAEGDTLLLCSDGLTRIVQDSAIVEALRAAPQAQRAADRLVELANDAGGDDNVTVIIIRTAPGEAPASRTNFARQQ